MSGSDNRRGVLIVLEGIDGVGKTTQADAITQFVEESGRTVVRSREPTMGKYGARLRRSMQEGRLSASEELDLFLRDRGEHVETLIEPSLAAGSVVLLDRYYFSTVAYQSLRGFDAEALLAQNEAFAPAPELLLVLDMDPRVGLARGRSRSGQAPDSFEVPEDLQQSRRIFLELASRYGYAHVINADQASEQVTSDILKVVGEMLKEKMI